MASRIGVLSEGSKLTMILPPSNRYYALNDRTINLLMKGKIDTNAFIGRPDVPKSSDAEIGELLEQDTEVLISVLNIKKTNQVVHSSPF